MPPKSSPSGRTADLFAGMQPGEAQRKATARIDGGARGNPGPAGYGVIVTDENGRVVARLSRYLGRQTNNFAEYSGLIAALDYALEHGFRALQVFSDSELLVRQLRGIYRVRNPELRRLHEQAQARIARLDCFGVEHVRREQNREADRLANRAMDEGTRKPV